MWQINVEPLSKPRGSRLQVLLHDQPARWDDVLDGWQADCTFRELFSKTLADEPWPAFRWETPLLTMETLVCPFECVVLNAPVLERPPEPDAFAEHFDDRQPIVSFANLRGDSLLIAPCPFGDDTACTHLAAFLRNADSQRQNQLWHTIALAVRQRLPSEPVWLSTAGAGVAWLHVRLDNRPKYYGYRAYRNGHL